jgi:hypothetical protein
MSERMTSRHKRLFEVRMLHHYWLDDGATVFDPIADQAKKNPRLPAYDMRSFLAVRPTAATVNGLSAFGCLFRETALGCVVLAPDTAVIPADTVFEFIVTAKQGSFHNYTALTLRPQKIYELFNAADNTADRVTYRYKANVPVLSNLTGTARGSGANRSLFLSSEIPAQATDDQVEALVRSGNALLQLTSDGPSATTQQLSPQATDLPVYVHQADAPAIVPPAGLSGVPARGVRLSEDVTDDVFALISLTAVRASDDTFSFVDGAGLAKDVSPVYQIHFKNRSTTWKYLNKRTGAVDSTEPNPLPLTYFGNAGSKQKPSEGFVKAEKSGAKVTRLVSEIYV